MDDPTEFVSSLKAEIGGDLRVAAEYTEKGYDLHYVRDDIEQRITELDIEHIHQELVLQGLGREHLEDLFDAGSLQCSVHRFDELTACHFARTTKSGLYVSFDSDATIQFKSFAETCEQFL